MIYKTFEVMNNASAVHQTMKFWKFLGVHAVVEIHIDEVKVFRGIYVTKGVTSDSGLVVDYAFIYV